MEARPFWKVAFLAIVMMILAAAMEPLLPALMAPLIDESMIARDPDSLTLIPIYIVLVYTARGITEFIGSVSSQYVAHKTVANIRSRLFAAQVDLPKQIISDDAAGVFTSRIIFNCSQIRQAVSTAWMILIKDSFVIIGLTGFLFYTSWQMSFAILLVAPLIGFIIRITNKRMRSSNRELQNWMARLTGFIEDSALSIDEIKIFSGHDSQIKSFDSINAGLVREQMRVVKIQSIVTPLVQVVTAVSIGGVILVGSHLSANNLLSPGEFVAYITAMGMLFSPIKRLTGVAAILQQGLAAADSIYDTLDAPSDCQTKKGNVVKAWPHANLVFEKVEFRYPKNDRSVLKNMTFTISKGETICLAGPSGSGKSTILSLIAGFLKPDKGRILINDRDIMKISISTLRQQISIVPQESNLLDTTILENIKFGNPEASSEQIQRAIEMSHCREFVESLPDDVNTMVGQRGLNLSGGQRQRICIARAFLKDAPILLLDEPTSALDAESRDQILLGLENLKANRTTIIISHQPEKLLAVDRTLLIQNGTITLTNA